MLWWLWAVLSLGSIFLVDIARNSVLLQFERYIFISSAAVYALLAMPTPGRLRWIAPLVLVLATAGASAARYQEGPHYQAGSVYMWEEDRYSAKFLKDHLRSGDAVVLTSNIVTYAEFSYLAIAHYNGEWHVPVVFLKSPMDANLKRQLFAYQRVWVVGRNPIEDTRDLLPGCKILETGGVMFDHVWRIK
jgi:hypothetical protein